MGHTDSSVGARRDRFVTVEGLEVHYSEWGWENDEVVLCVHGFSRPGRDFDPLADALSDSYRVLCPELPGRPLSEWSDDPEADYDMAGSNRIIGAFCEKLGLTDVRYVGTSMGGSLGIYAGANELQGTMSRLVVNDSGPGQLEGETIEDEGIERIVSYLSSPPSFDALTQLEAYFRENYAPFSEMTDEEWRRFTLTAARRMDDGTVTPDYDTAAVDPYFADPNRTQLWEQWDALDVPTLVLRGEDSDVLLPEVAAEMERRRTDCTLIEVQDCGHAPSLNVPEQIQPIRAFFSGDHDSD